MTRKDYILLAEALHIAPVDREEYSPDLVRGLEIQARAVADALAAQSSGFDRERFLRAAGVTGAER